MNAAARERLAPLLTPRLSKYVPHDPTPKQQAGLILPHPEVFYGGAAGGGKSDWLLMGALQYADQPGWAALLLRRTFRELAMEGGLMERAHEWLGPTDARWSSADNAWTFPSGAVLQFGYMEGAHDHMRYQGSEWRFVGFDELTHFREKQYRYLFSRLRRLAGSQLPTRMRATSNPGGPGHEWVKNRFGIYRPDGDEDLRKLCQRPDWVRDQNRVFIPAGLRDNPHLDRDDYERSLAELDPTTRAQLLDGDWDAHEPGEMFRREWWKIVDTIPEGCEFVRYWDLAATEPHEGNSDPDWTAGCLLGKHPNGEWYVADVVRVRRTAGGVEQIVKQTAALDGVKVPVHIEQEGGASGKSLIVHYQRDVLPAHEVRGHAPSDSKGVRARPVSSKTEAGLVHLLRGSWVPAFLDEADTFPAGDDGHDDQIDALSGAFTVLASPAGVKRTPYISTGQEPVIRKGDLTLRGQQYIDKE